MVLVLVLVVFGMRREVRMEDLCGPMLIRKSVEWEKSSIAERRRRGLLGKRGREG